MKRFLVLALGIAAVSGFGRPAHAMTTFTLTELTPGTWDLLINTDNNPSISAGGSIGITNAASFEGNPAANAPCGSDPGQASINCTGIPFNLLDASRTGQLILMVVNVVPVGPTRLGGLTGSGLSFLTDPADALFAGTGGCGSFCAGPNVGFVVTPIPEPSTALLLGMGLASLAWLRRSPA
jgi:hypothetical protein